MSWEGLDNPRGESAPMTRGYSEVQPESFSRGNLDEPLQTERQLMEETYRVASLPVQESRESENMQRDSRRRVPVPSQVADVFEAPMRRGLYGVTKMNTYPFEVLINNRVMKPRQLISLTHEMLHIWAKLHKVEELPHDKLHDLAVFIFSEIVPVVNRYKERTK
jgi:hypothetical protein